MTSSTVSMTGSVLPKWQVALTVGASVALGVGYMYYRNSNKPKSPILIRGKSKGSSKENGAPIADKQISIDVDCPPDTTPKIETQLEIARRFKDEGNCYFRKGIYDEAIAQYSNAIEKCPKEYTEDLAIFYQNRAAAYEQLKKYNAVKEDCTKALELKPKYPKALLRRARVKEQCKDLESALEDITVTFILEDFSNVTTLAMADRLLKQLGRQQAVEYLKNKKTYVMPSKQTITDYMTYFQRDPIFTLLKNGDNSNLSPGFINIMDHLREEKYDDIIPLCTKALENPESDILPHEMEMLLLRGTFFMLKGQSQESINDFSTIIDSKNVSKDIKVNALIKRVNVNVILESEDDYFSDFESAVQLDANNCDIYVHRGMTNFFMTKVVEAKEDFTKAVQLDPDFAFAYMQKCNVEFNYSDAVQDKELTTDYIRSFEKIFEKFPNFIEAYFLVSLILMETENYEEAESCLAKGLEKNPDNAKLYRNKGLLYLKWHNDVDRAYEYFTQALKLDKTCKDAYEPLAMLEAMRGNVEKALSLLDELLLLSYTLSELTRIFGLRNSVKVQFKLQNGFDPNMLKRGCL